jgi:hypothetical protein
LIAVNLALQLYNYILYIWKKILFIIIKLVYMIQSITQVEFLVKLNKILTR